MEATYAFAGGKRLPVAISWLLLVAIALGFGWHVRHSLHDRAFFGDLRAYYCGARAVREGHDPALAESLAACERPLFRKPGNAYFLLPAPLPGWSLVMIEPLGWGSYRIAELVYAALAVAALIASAWFLARIAGIPLLVSFSALAWTDGYFSMNHGSPSIFELLAITAAAFCLQRERYRLAGLLGAATLFEPHAGAPVVLALLLWVPRSRVALVVGLAVLAAAGIAAIGFAGNFTYLTQELPAHARAELYFPFQYSLSWLLAYAHVPARLALALGTLSYAVLAVTGIVAARRFARVRETAALVVLFPVACAMLGGSFTHLYQVSFAVPAAVVLASLAAGRARLGFAIGVMLLMVPWQILFVENAKTRILAALVFGALLVFFVAYELLARGAASPVAARRAAAMIAFAVPILGFVAVAFRPFPADPVLSADTIARIVSAGPLASEHWAVYVDEAWQGKRLSLRILLTKGYDWAGLIVVIALGLRSAWRRPAHVSNDAFAAVPVVAPTIEAPVPTPAHFALADAIRAGAIVLVVCSHLLPSIDVLGGIAASSLAFGAWGVDAFFVLSGMLLGRPYVDTLLGRRTLPDATLYARRRFLRIWPAYAVAVIGSFAMASLHHGRHASSVADVAAHLVLIHNLFPRFVEGVGNAALWTMAVDAQFYLALPIVAWLVLGAIGTRSVSRPRAVLGLIAGAIVASIAWRLFAIHAFPTQPANVIFKVAQRNLIGMGFCFAMGGLIAYAQAAGVTVSPRGARVLCALGVAFALVSFGSHAWLPGAWSAYAFFVMDACGTLSVACIIFGASQLRSRGIARVCESRIVTAFAANAYALYLVHLPLLLAVHATLERHRIHDGTRAFSVLIVAGFLPSAAVAAYALHRFVETPFLTLKERNREIAVVTSRPDDVPTRAVVPV